ncbi:hypothetical protein [uncultured Parolsenella sp.]|uniref:hypothetical protein n=1 Tax=uncultured Parolsenella sp. TaxID=2083008 RepID=UPI0025F5657C|nr:hypothetical protein [uncultured Parolsenella sp.]
MADRIIVTDAKAAELEQRCIRELDQYYPEHVIEHAIDSEHKKLSERLAKARKLIGYASRTEMLEAWGFEVRTNMGRPRTFDPVALMEELARRYENRQKPGTVSELIGENPDLEKALSNAKFNSRKLYGAPFTEALRERGLLASAEKSAEKRKERNEAKIQECLDDLVSRYAHLDPTDRPSTVAALKKLHPNYASLLAGVGKERLALLGIIGERNKPKVESDGDLKAAIVRAGRELCDVLPSDKPRALADLTSRYPSFGPQVKEAVRLKLTSKEFLYEAGILNPPQKFIAEHGIRAISPDELAPAVCRQLGSTTIMPGDVNAADLPPYVLGLDLREGLELRSALVVRRVGQQDLHVGDELDAVAAQFYASFFMYGTDMPSEDYDPYPYGLFAPAGDHPDSPLSELVGAKVVGVFEHAGERMAQLELRYLANLNGANLLALLRNRGAITASDFNGTMGWRYRLGLVDFERELEMSSCSGESSEPADSKPAGATTSEVADPEPAETMTSEAADPEPAVEPVEQEVDPCPEPSAPIETLNKKPAEPHPTDETESFDDAPSSGEPNPSDEVQPSGEEDSSVELQTPDLPTVMLTLLSDDYVFFQDNEISWSKGHHVIKGLQVNSPKQRDLATIAVENGFDDINDLLNYFIAFMSEVEKDEALVIPKASISKALHPIVRRGDLTGITLANLAASMAAFRVLNDKPNSYTVVYASTLADGIPHFFDLICRLLWDLRLCMTSLKGVPFQVTFARCLNLDLSQLLKGNVSRVDGAQDDPGTVDVTDAPAIDLKRGVTLRPAAAAPEPATKPEPVATPEPAPEPKPKPTPTSAPTAKKAPTISEKRAEFEKVLDHLLTAATKYCEAVCALGQLEEDERTLEEMPAKKKRLEKKIHSIQRKQQSISDELAENASCKHDLQEERKQLLSRADTLEEKAHELEEERGGLGFFSILRKSQIDSVLKTIASRQDEIRTYTEQIDEELKSLARTRKKLLKDIKEPEEKIAPEQAKLEALLQEEKETKDRLENAEKSRGTLSTERSTAKGQRTKALKRYNDLISSQMFTSAEKKSDEYREIKELMASALTKLEEQGITPINKATFPTLKA